MNALVLGALGAALIGLQILAKKRREENEAAARAGGGDYEKGAE